MGSPADPAAIRTSCLETLGAVTAAASFEEVYRRSYRDVYRYVLALTRAADETDDIVAETFERAFRTWTAAAPERPVPWLLLTARRIATDRWRRARHLTGLLPRLMARPSMPATEERTEFWLWFDALARTLTDRQREVLVLRYQRDLDDHDIATIMGISASGVRSLVNRALEVLRSHPELLR